MSNYLKHIAVKNYYYSGKRFGSASTQYSSEQAAYKKWNHFTMTAGITLFLTEG